MKKAKKTEGDFKQWIRTSIDFYAPILGLQLHRVKIEKDAKESYLAITCNYPYLDPTIKFSDDAFKTWQKGGMKRDRILHELCHILTDPFYVKAIYRYTGKDEITDERERLTDTIAAIVRNFTDEK